MNIKQAIQSSANVVRITNITIGDVYKRFDTSYDDRVIYGVVRNVHNDGEVAVIESLEYTKRFGDLDINTKIIRGDKDMALFPADPYELNVELSDIVAKKQREASKKAEEIKKLEAEVAELNSIISGEALRDLKAMSYAELSQQQYNQKKLEAKSDIQF